MDMTDIYFSEKEELGDSTMASKVKRVEPKKRKSAKKKDFSFKLPDKPREIEKDILKFCTLIYGRPGIGKTSWAISWPDAILFSCERISMGLSCYDFNAENGGVTDWKTFKAGVSLLEEDSRFKTVVIDTVDKAYEHCLQHVCKTRGITHPEDEPWGKGWNAVKREFADTLYRIRKTGRGLVFISHAMERDITSFSNQKYTKVVPTMAGQAYSHLKGITDLTLYTEYMSDVKGRNIRVLITEGDEVIDAKNSLDFPRFLELPNPKEGGSGYEQMVRAMNKEEEGIPASHLMPSKQTSKASGDFVRSAKSSDAKSKKKKASSKKKVKG